MRLHARARDVLLVLAETEQPVKIRQLAKRFNVSERTIKYDLEHIREQIAERDVRLQSRTNRGIWLEGDEAAKRRLRETLASGESASFDNYRERRGRLALLLLARSGFATLEQLAESVQASRNTVLSDLQKAETSWRKWGIRLEREPGKGVRLVGAEPDKRRLLQALAESLLTGSDMLRIVRGLWEGSAWPRDLANKLEACLLPRPDMERVQAAAGRTIRLWKERLGETAPDEAAIGVLFRLAVAVRRLRVQEALPGVGPDPLPLADRSGNGPETIRTCRLLLTETFGELLGADRDRRREQEWGLGEADEVNNEANNEANEANEANGASDDNEVNGTSEVTEANGASEDNEANETDVQYSLDAETAYVLMPLLPDADKGREPLPAERIRKRLELAAFVRGLIERLAARTDVPLGRDSELYEGLLAHLIRKAERRRMGVHDADPLAAEIARTYPGLYADVKQACLELEGVHRVQPDESDVAYIVLYVQTALERERETVRYRVVVVCGTGKGTARLLKTLIQNRVRRIEVADCCSVAEAESAVVRTGADLAISVLPMELTVPVVRVNPLPTGEDFAAIAACLERLASAGANAAQRRENNRPGGPSTSLAGEAAGPPAPLAEALGRLEPASWPAAEQAARELTIRGFELTQAIVGRFGANLTEAAAAGLSLHVLLMVQRLAFGHPYEDAPAAPLPAETPTESQWREALAALFREYGLPEAEGEQRAILRYFHLDGERGSR